MVQKVELDHNHYLASSDNINKLRPQRCITEADRKLIGQSTGSWDEACPGV
jgi:hypothetical protein